jgi:pyruvate,water dikinase
MSAATTVAPDPRRWIHVPRAVPSSPERVGGKGYHLERLAALTRASESRFTVPRFIVLTTAAFDDRMAGLGPWPRDEQEARARADAIRMAPLPPAAIAELAAALETAGLFGARVAVRSSATSEDGAERSFAGQFDTVLGVPVTHDLAALLDAVRQVWASAFHARAAAYARGAGVRMAVVIQEMVEPRASGVAFSIDPVTGARDTAVVCAVYGLGEGLVSGALDADTFRVHFGGARPTVTAALARKTQATRLDLRGGARLEPVPESLQSAPALRDEEAILIATTTRRLAEDFGAHQDVEWAWIGTPGALVVLQARPITAMAEEPLGARRGDAPEASRGERRVWDNSNIVESYAGVTTPLTFSFALEVYESVYRQFCRLMGTPAARIESNRLVFANLLGLMRGRVYYNLLNWYRTLALLPGFRWNRAFMERMMGVREPLQDDSVASGSGDQLGDLGSLLWMTVRMTREAGKLRREVPEFHARVQREIGPLVVEDVAAWPAARALALYRRLERELLQQWRAPLVNDFFAMVFFGVLGRLTERWMRDAPGTFVNDLLCGEGGIVSTEPARRVMALARSLDRRPAVRAAFDATRDDLALLARLRAEPEAAAFVAELDAYLHDFGDRCMEELKLETVTLAEDPRFLIAMIRAYAAQGMTDPDAAWERERAIRRAAESQVRARLHGPKHALYRWVLVRARRRVRDRENLRFERTRVFGVVRRIVLALGRHLAAAGRIADPRDVFFLARAEVFAYFDGTAVTSDLRALVARRRAEFETYAREPGPPDRFETWGPPGQDVPRRASASPGARAESELRGTGCCPGVVRAPVRVVRDPRAAGALTGSILVAERTDPGWTLLFPAARGLLVERGSLLSHSAIVAREIGLPCVVGIAGLLDTLVDGEIVEMDGTSGIVRRTGERG